ncbi:Phosphoglycerate dehydrogenase [Tepidanaerobacter acetatoxydans Re1]|uniref:Phosphoglycerate dehydrogenase n=1 Tax=Tepidanaerobacter acetatoxydans (strain DSM 21804 / JCM 16047 / Re1) TaxID=1209989 RepID=F4LRD2_TEPAE|nr:2-hydroxyacid dehydrogenase [Tepidanaerobacter acetatoxydans]AEE92268.1 Phosphoglycerate dehydrogenase [Tepidanaerobacter acetatoxydans Re1]CDI40955.1 Phosphoglycerate dehydrogenase [Tepidanaerobacter acetatoxydans Re1]
MPSKKMKALLVGDAMIPVEGFEKATRKYLSDYVEEIYAYNWEENWDRLQERRLIVEKNGPEVEDVLPFIEKAIDAEMLLGLFVPVSKRNMDLMPNLKIVGVARAGLENVNVKEATRRGIIVFNVRGRNAEAVSDFAVGLMIAECRNIARAHHAIKNGIWRKEFSNSDWTPELNGKTVGLVGFGYIGKLVAKKLSGFGVNIIIYDPFVKKEKVEELGFRHVDKDTLFRESDFISLHARLSKDTKNLVSEKELSLMKPTAYLINTARAGLIDQEALTNALKNKKIAGAGLDVFWEEPLPENSEFLELDNVTLTTHIAGTTKEALTRSPELLVRDIEKFLSEGKADFIINPEVLEKENVKKWLKELKV